MFLVSAWLTFTSFSSTFCFDPLVLPAGGGGGVKGELSNSGEPTSRGLIWLVLSYTNGTAEGHLFSMPEVYFLTFVRAYRAIEVVATTGFLSLKFYTGRPHNFVELVASVVVMLGGHTPYATTVTIAVITTAKAVKQLFRSTTPRKKRKKSAQGWRSRASALCAYFLPTNVEDRSRVAQLRVS